MNSILPSLLEESEIKPKKNKKNKELGNTNSTSKSPFQSCKTKDKNESSYKNSNKSTDKNKCPFKLNKGFSDHKRKNTFSLHKALDEEYNINLFSGFIAQEDKQSNQNNGVKNCTKVNHSRINSYNPKPFDYCITTSTADLGINKLIEIKEKKENDSKKEIDMFNFNKKIKFQDLLASNKKNTNGIKSELFMNKAIENKNDKMQIKPMLLTNISNKFKSDKLLFNTKKFDFEYSVNKNKENTHTLKKKLNFDSAAFIEDNSGVMDCILKNSSDDNSLKEIKSSIDSLKFYQEFGVGTTLPKHKLQSDNQLNQHQINNIRLSNKKLISISSMNSSNDSKKENSLLFSKNSNYKNLKNISKVSLLSQISGGVSCEISEMSEEKKVNDSMSYITNQSRFSEVSQKSLYSENDGLVFDFDKEK